MAIVFLENELLFTLLILSQKKKKSRLSECRDSQKGGNYTHIQPTHSSIIINLPNKLSNGKIMGFPTLMKMDKVKTDLFYVCVNVFSLMWLELEEIQSLA